MNRKSCFVEFPAAGKPEHRGNTEQREHSHQKPESAVRVAHSQTRISARKCPIALRSSNRNKEQTLSEGMRRRSEEHAFLPEPADRRDAQQEEPKILNAG